MKRQIRYGLFETNSSSTHCLVMCSGEDYNKWLSGELVYDHWNEKLVPLTEETQPDEDRYYTSEGYDDDFGEYYELFADRFSSDSGDEVVAFGYYGYCG